MAGRRDALDERALGEALRGLEGWTSESKRGPDGGERVGLARTLEFASFEDAMHFMATAARRIARMDHHPEWTNVYSTLTIRLSTHSAGHRPTRLDVELARYLEALYGDYRAEP